MTLTQSAYSQEDRQANRDLIAATRDLMRAVSLMDADSKELQEVEQQVRALADQIEPGRQRVFPSPVMADISAGVRPLRIFENNPQGIPLEIHFADDRAFAQFIPGPLLEGPVDRVHGGFSAALLDITLGTMVQALHAPALTAHLDLTFRKSLPLDKPLDIEARIVDIDGRKVTAEGWIACDGERGVVAKGLFVSPAGGGPSWQAGEAGERA